VAEQRAAVRRGLAQSHQHVVRHVFSLMVWRGRTGRKGRKTPYQYSTAPGARVQWNNAPREAASCRPHADLAFWVVFPPTVFPWTFIVPALRLGVAPRDGALALAAGLLGAGAFWPVALWPLMLVSVALFLRLLRDQDTQPARYLGLLYGLTFAGGTLHWLFRIFGFWALPLVTLMAAYFCLLATLVALTRGQPVAARAALVALLAVAVEWLRGDAWYLRFPWYTPPHALAAAPPCVAGARWVGTYGLSYVIWFIAAAGAFGRPAVYGSFLLLPACWLLLPAEGEPDCRALLVQIEWAEPTSALPEERVDLVVLPELAYLRSPASVLAEPNGPAALARHTSSPVVFGAVEGTYAKMPFSNVAAVVGPDGRLLGTFPKQRPVPLLADGTPGARRPVFAVDGGVLGVAVCFDFDAPAVAGDLVRSGATVLVAPTLDARGWGRAQHEHHALLFRLRAVENDRWVVRAASSGRTEVISPRGVASVEGIEIGATGQVVLPFAHRDSWAPGGRLAWLGPAAAVGAALFLGWRGLTWARRRLSGASSCCA
jgi:apolipoprotein N-acyltransferase